MSLFDETIESIQLFDWGRLTKSIGAGWKDLQKFGKEFGRDLGFYKPGFFERINPFVRKRGFLESLNRPMKSLRRIRPWQLGAGALGIGALGYGLGSRRRNPY